MKSMRICAALLAAAIAVPAFGQVSVYIGTPPPALRYERRGPIRVRVLFGWKDMGALWAPLSLGYGPMERPPYEGAYWNHPHYDHYREGWQLHEGHWDHEDHDNGHWRDHHDEGDHH